MAYYLDLFSPQTYEAYKASDQTVSGFRRRQQNAANKLVAGDKLVCYLTKLSRWFGVLEVVAGPYRDDSPRFYSEDDPFVIRFTVRPIVLLDIDKSVPIHEESVWDRLSFTRGHAKNATTWTGKVRVSLGQLDDEDGRFLEDLLLEQSRGDKSYPVDPHEYQRLLTRRIRRTDRTVSVTVPEDEEEESSALPADQVTEATQIQALLAQMGERMGMSIWLPRADRTRVLTVWDSDDPPLLQHLPLNYDDTTLGTIEQIDVLWLSGRAIVRAFEVEHTTSIYSGILRMADLLALQPNLDIKLHIVAPIERREKVFHELQRPVFSLLERRPLAETCTYLSYDSVREISSLPHMRHLLDSVLNDYSEEVE